MSDFTYRPQQVDYLGFLEAQLRDLQGVDQLAYELIQNADDVQAASGEDAPTRLTFDVRDEALVVENDGEFRPVDFRRMQRIAGGGKRQEAGTTGAFGLGFIAVYQVTDAPEIYSANLHWTIHPEAPPERRIEERPAQTEGTRFVLPWAFDHNTPVRRALRIEAIDRHALDAFARELASAVDLAALFLRRLQVLEVRRNGALLHTVLRDASDPQRLVLRDGGSEPLVWYLFGGDFESEAAQLRQSYAGQIEKGRHGDVTLAVAGGEPPAQGRLYAVLPTEATMPLPLHINADFFPTTDRRRVHFDGGYQARWNEAALTCAASLLARHLHDLRQTLAPEAFWRLLQGAWRTAQRAVGGELPGSFAAFWQVLTPHLSQAPLVFTADERWLPPGAVRIAHANGDLVLLQALDIPIVHPQLGPYAPLMRRPEVGVADLALVDVAQALRELGLREGAALYQAPHFLHDLNGWRRLWSLVQDLLGGIPRHERQQTIMPALGDAPLVVDRDMTLRSLRRVYDGDDEAQRLFPGVAWMHPDLDREAFPARYVTRFGARQAVDHLSLQSEEQLQEAWRVGRLDLPALFRWLESRQIEILADDPSLKRDILNLPLCPIDGELRPLAHLYIPGGFDDPLQLTGVVDLQAIGGRRQFLQDLGMQELDFETYVYGHVPRALQRHIDLPSDARHRLLQLLAQRLGQIRDDEELRQQLHDLPLIPCMDGSFRAAREVYASRQAASLLGPRAHIAEPAPSDAVQALYQWLDVRRQPAAADLVQRLVAFAGEEEPLAEEALTTIRRCWDRLQEMFGNGVLSDDHITQLRQERTLPNRLHEMRLPGSLLFVDQPQLLQRLESAGAALDRYLLWLDEHLPTLMETAGVRRFSKAVTLEVIAARRSVPAPELEARIRQRRPLIKRLLPAEQAHGGDPLRALHDLRVLRLRDLQIRYRLSPDGERFVTEPEAQQAVFVASQKTLYVDATQEVATLDSGAWVAVARELALALMSTSDRYNGSPGGLALGIREVLAAETFDAASDALDELGYP